MNTGAPLPSPVNLAVSVVHLDDGFDCLGWRIQRRRRRGSSQRFLYTYPSKKALLSVTGKLRTLTRRARRRCR